MTILPGIILGLLAALLLPESAAMQGVLPPTPCNGLFGCGGGSENLVAAAVPKLAQFLILVAGSTAVLFMAWTGFQMVLALGNDSKLGELKWSAIYVLAGLVVVILAQLLVSTVGTTNLGQGQSGELPRNLIASGVNIILTLFNVAFIISIIIAGIRMVYAQGKSDEYNTGRKIIFWSVIGAVLVNLSNALVQALAVLFGA